MNDDLIFSTRGIERFRIGTQCPSKGLSITPKDDTEDILQYARQLAIQPRNDTIMGDKRYDLEIPEDTHWELVKLAADLKMHHEDYAQNVLIGHVESELDRKAQAGMH
jgi:hypothetical protein